MKKFKLLKTILASITLCAAISTTAFAGDYTVTPGDSLYKIGNLFNISKDTIINDNALKSSTIYPGQVLKISCTTYTVKSGDSLYLIAKKYGISLYSLRKANGKWEDTLYTGEVLNIPNTTSNSGNSATSKPIVNYTENDLDLLSRLITAEAQDQPYSAQVAVAAVVLNRIKSSTFPNTISSVIYEKSSGYYQFTPVENGWINKSATTTSKKAAKEALYGSDPSKGALYYFDDSATNKWLLSKPVTIKIGNMVFVK